MSREFGEYGGCGYFHTKVRAAAEDCDGGGDEFTRAFGALLRPLADVAYEISNCEACDSGPSNPRIEWVRRHREIVEATHELERIAGTARDALEAGICAAVEAVVTAKRDGDALKLLVPESIEKVANDYSMRKRALDRVARREWHRLGLPGVPYWSSSSSGGGSSVSTYWYRDARSATWTLARECLDLFEAGKTDEVRALLRSVVSP